MQRVCEFDPNRYLELGDYFVEKGQPERAAEAYQKGVDLAPDRVMMANKCRWLVNYLDDHGHPEKALRIANEAGEVYSYDGLETLGRLKEKHGQLKEARVCFQNIAERYDDQAPLHAFYRRNRDKDPEFEKTAASLEREAFPGGLTKTVLADFKIPPEDGTTLTSNSASANAAGLHAGDVIVAIDGYRVRTQAQYSFIRGLTEDPNLHLIVWNARGFRELAAKVAGRRFNVDLADYHGGKN